MQEIIKLIRRNDFYYDVDQGWNIIHCEWHPLGLLFSEWFPILLTGTLLLVAELVRRLIEYHEMRETPDPIRILQLDQEEI